MIASKRFEGNFDGNYYFYYYDIRGSVSGIFGPANEVVKDYQYTLYGEVTVGGNPNFKNEIGFTGSITDETGLNYMHARFYSSNTGRFISEDSFGGYMAQPWTQNLYSYCGNNPVSFVDPSGHFPSLSSPLGMVNCGGMPKTGCECFRCVNYWKDRVDVSKKIDELPEIVKQPIKIEEPSRPSKSVIAPKQTNSSTKSGETTSQEKSNGGFVDTLKNSVKMFVKIKIEPAVDIVKLYWKSRHYIGGELNTVEQGLSWSAGAGARFGQSYGIATDALGNVGLVINNEFGGGTPSVALSAYNTFTDAPIIYELEGGPYLDIGGSVTVVPKYNIGIGGDYQTFRGKDANYNGFSGNIGVGFGAPAEFHGGAGNTSIIYSFNAFDTMDVLLNSIYGW